MRGSARHMDKLARLNRVNRIKNGRHLRQKIRKLAGPCDYKDDGDFASFKVLLVLHPSVKRQKDLKARVLRQKQQLTVFLPCPTCFRDRVAFVSRQMIFEFSWKTLVQQQFH